MTPTYHQLLPEPFRTLSPRQGQPRTPKARIRLEDSPSPSPEGYETEEILELSRDRVVVPRRIQLVRPRGARPPSRPTTCADIIRDSVQSVNTADAVHGHETDEVWGAGISAYVRRTPVVKYSRARDSGLRLPRQLTNDTLSRAILPPTYSSS